MDSMIASIVLLLTLNFASMYGCLILEPGFDQAGSGKPSVPKNGLTNPNVIAYTHHTLNQLPVNIQLREGRKQ